MLNVGPGFGGRGASVGTGSAAGAGGAAATEELFKKAAEVIQETPQILLKKFSIYTRNKKYANAVSVLEKFGDKK